MQSLLDKAQELAATIRNHGIHSYTINGELYAVDESMHKGIHHVEVIKLPIDRRAVMHWLGY